MQAKDLRESRNRSRSRLLVYTRHVTTRAVLVRHGVHRALSGQQGFGGETSRGTVGRIHALATASGPKLVQTKQNDSSRRTRSRITSSSCAGAMGALCTGVSLGFERRIAA